MQVAQINKARARRDQLRAMELDTRIDPKMHQLTEPHELHSRQVDKARHARVVEECGVTQPPVQPLLQLDKALHLLPTPSPVA